VNLRGREAARLVSAPPADLAGALLYGADAMRVALKRQELIAALAGPEADAEMRLTRLAPGDLRADPAAATDALKAVGFFPGPRVVFVEGLGEAQARPVLAALEARAPGDATLVVTAGALKKGSKLRIAFEAHPAAAAIAFYDDPMTGAELDALVEAEGLRLDPEARLGVEALSQALDPGDLRQTLARMTLWADGTEMTAADVALLAPATQEAEAAQAVTAAAEGRAAEIGALMRRLDGQGVSAVTLAIAATRHFGQLHAAAVAGGVGNLRPPVFGPRRQAMEGQVRAWGARRLEAALALLMETDLTLRSTSRAPAMAVMERALIRLAMMRG
jgi:DNA polymerase-3 subunit delta